MTKGVRYYIPVIHTYVQDIVKVRKRSFFESNRGKRNPSSDLSFRLIYFFIIIIIIKRFSS